MTDLEKTFTFHKAIKMYRAGGGLSAQTHKCRLGAGEGSHPGFVDGTHHVGEPLLTQVQEHHQVKATADELVLRLQHTHKVEKTVVRIISLRRICYTKPVYVMTETAPVNLCSSYPLVRPVELIDVKVLNVQVKLLFAQLAGRDGVQVRACRVTRVTAINGGRKALITAAHPTGKKEEKGK